MIKINNITYNNSSIQLKFVQFQELLLESTNSTVVWEIIKFPNSSNNSSYSPKFTIANNKKSTNNPERLRLDISGNYYIKIVERDLKGNYQKVDLYLQIVDLINKTSIPMVGETFEFDEENGWAKTIESNIQQLNQKNLAKIIKGFSENELELGNLVYITSVHEQNTSGFTFNIDNILNYEESQNIQLGIVVEKISLNLEEDEDNFIYVVLFKGILNVSENFSLEVDELERFFYDSEENELTSKSSDSFVGKFLVEERIIMMESEIYLFGTYQDIFSALIINP